MACPLKKRIKEALDLPIAKSMQKGSQQLLRHCPHYFDSDANFCINKLHISDY